MKYIIALLLTVLVQIVQAEAVAQVPNEGNGYIVLTNEICKVNKKTFPELRRVYNYTAKGDTEEGCFLLEHETVVVIWESGNKTRYSVNIFTIINRGKSI